MKKFVSMGAVLGVAIAAGLATTAQAQISIITSNVSFVDISVSGTALTPNSDDSEANISAAVLTAAGFNGNGLLAGGVDVRVGNNGGVIWNPTGTMEVGWANANAGNATATSIATMQASNTTIQGNGNGNRQFLAPLWDDNFPGAGGGIRWQVIAGDLYIQWTNQDHFNAQGTGTATYQMVVRGGVAIGGGSLVDFVYQDTLYAAQAYQNDGGSATIGYKNWGVNPDANDVEYGVSGGSGNTTTDPAFGHASMAPKVGGWLAAGDANLPHSLSIIPAPGAAALMGMGMLIAGRRRRN